MKTWSRGKFSSPKDTEVNAKHGRNGRNGFLDPKPKLLR